jgi:outer membrane protein TolC
VNASRILPIAALTLAACAVHPRGEREERDRAEAAKAELGLDTEPVPLPDDPGPEDFLRTAFSANADLRARYWDWRAALERIPQEASPPNPALSFSYLLGGPSMKAWDRTTLGIQNDPTAMIPLPTKLRAAGERALEDARVAGLRFEAAKFRLQARVLTRYVDLALHREMMRIEDETAALLELESESASAGLASGKSRMEEVLRARSDADLSKDRAKGLHGELATLEAEMNALLGRPFDAPIPLPASMPAPRAIPADDAEILELAAERNPELVALAREVAGKESALEIARQQWIPDFALSFEIMGSATRTVGGMLTLPLRTEAIEGAIEEARANLRAAEEEKMQFARDLAASFVLDLFVLRNDERQARLFEEVLLPRARLAAGAAESAYASGSAGISAVIEARRAVLESERTLAELRAQREKALVAIETSTALDVEALHPVRLGAASGRE